MRPQRVPVTERTLVRRSYDCFNRRDPEGAFPLYTKDCRWSFRHFSGWPDEQEYRGHAGLVRLFGDFLSAWGEFAIHPTGLWDLGDDRWLIRCHMEATGVSSGVPLEADFWQLAKVRDRCIHTVDNYTDDDEVLADAGATADDL
ncbi:MAG TPA: nuclear transport factor 2 family protein [Solirubrobacteraceae bacterium]|nr:nuclear transport factor 2 family protein [Solirubrobacteraceae bacterium]